MEKVNLRKQAKAASLAKCLEAARRVWAEPGSYDKKGIRDIAAAMGMSTGAVFLHFKSKDDVWRAAFGCEPPVDSALTRAAPLMRDLLREARAEIDAEPAPRKHSGNAEDWRQLQNLSDRIRQALLQSEPAHAVRRRAA